MTTQPADVPMGQCTVTGNMVREDELVTFQGHARLCRGESHSPGIGSNPARPCRVNSSGRE